MSKKIAVIAANSPSGRPIVKEAVKRGNDVTVFVQNENTTIASKVVQKQFMDLTKEDLAGFDAVVDAGGAWTDELLPNHYAALFHFCDCLSGADAKLVIVGGEGTSYDDSTLARWFGQGTVHEHNEYNANRAILTKWFGSDSFMSGLAPLADDGFTDSFGDRPASMESVFEGLKKRKDVNWIYMSPSCDFTVAGQSVAAYDDYAVDVVDEIESGIHYQQRIGVTCD